MQIGPEEGAGASIIACGDAPPVLEFSKEDFDLVPMTIERLVVIDRRLAAFGRWGAGLCPTRFERCAEPVAVIAPVGQS